jgi:hypothetical protein
MKNEELRMKNKAIRIEVKIILHSSFLILHLKNVADADDEGDFVAKVGICYCYGDGSDE